MPDPIEPQTPQAAEPEEFVMKPEEATSLTDVEIAQKRADFYKNLLKKERVQKAQPPVIHKDDTVERFDARLSEVEQRVELRSDGYSVDEIRAIQAFAKGANKDLLEASKDPFVQAAITKMREKEQSEAATPSPSNAAVLTSGKSLGEVVTSGTATEKDAALQEILNRKRST